MAHSSGYDFKTALYIPLRRSQLNKDHVILLPQEKGKEVITKDIIKACDVVIAEVSYPSTGQGIELGWADMFNMPIICIYQQGNTYSGSLTKLTRVFVPYTNSEDLIVKLNQELRKLNK